MLHTCHECDVLYYWTVLSIKWPGCQKLSHSKKKHNINCWKTWHKSPEIWHLPKNITFAMAFMTQLNHDSYSNRGSGVPCSEVINYSILNFKLQLVLFLQKRGVVILLFSNLSPPCPWPWPFPVWKTLLPNTKPDTLTYPSDISPYTGSLTEFSSLLPEGYCRTYPGFRKWVRETPRL